MKNTGLIKIVTLFILIVIIVNMVHGQVTIGSSKTPQKGALLQLEDNGTYADGQTTTKGLLLPRVNITNPAPTSDADLALSIGATGSWGMEDHIGLVVYNLSERTTADGLCPGLHVWNGTKWQPVDSYRDGETRDIPVGTPTSEGLITLLTSYLQSVNDPSSNGIIDPNDPKWAELGINPSDYPLGAISNLTMTDADGNEYSTQRFYVGYQKVTGEFQKQKNYSCSPKSAPIWVNVGDPYSDADKVILKDGIWITSSVYSTQKAGGGAFDLGSDLDNRPVLNPAYRNNNNVADIVRVNVGGLSTTATVRYGQTTAATISGSWNENVTQQDFASKFGLLYTHNQAHQVCPDGWYLPSEFDWGAVLSAHDNQATAYTSIRAKPINGQYFFRSADDVESGWSHPSPEPSGFSMLPSGSAWIDPTAIPSAIIRIYNFGFQSEFWTTQTMGPNNDGVANYLDANMYRGGIQRPMGCYASVRCLKE